MSLSSKLIAGLIASASLVSGVALADDAVQVNVLPTAYAAPAPAVAPIVPVKRVVVLNSAGEVMRNVVITPTVTKRRGVSKVVFVPAN